MKRLILLLALVLPLAVSGEVYKWTDEKGNVHYGDRVDESQEAKKLPEFHYKSPVPSTVSPPQGATAPTEGTVRLDSDFPLEGTQQLQPSRYLISIVSPTGNGTVRDNQGVVSVAIRTVPLPRYGALYQMYLDGEPWYQPFAGQRANLAGVDRGTHTIHVELLSASGEKLGESNKVTFHLHQASSINRKRTIRKSTPPSARPPPASNPSGGS